MRILFVPYYYYMQYAPFQSAAEALAKDGHEARLLYIPGISERDEGDTYHPEKFRLDGVPFEEFDLVRFSSRWARALRPLSQLAQFLINKRRLRRFLAKRPPDAVVIASHLGGIYIRLIQLLCDRLRIPIVSMWIIPVTVGREKRSLLSRLPSFFDVRDVLRWTPANKHVRNHLFVASGQVLKEHLETLGIDGRQIRITGNPVHDLFQRDLAAPRDELRRTIVKERELQPEDRYVLLLTETIQKVLGWDYLRSLTNDLRAIFEKLPAGIKVIVKFHPREPMDAQIHFQDVFRGSRYRFCRDAELVPLLRCADLAIAHFSGALETALALGTPSLGINFTQRQDLSLFRESSMLLEAHSAQALEEKVLACLSDSSFRDRMAEARDLWLRENTCALDGQNSRRMAEAIVQHIERSPRRFRS